MHGGVLADELPGGGGVEDLGGSILVCLVLKQGMGFFLDATGIYLNISRAPPCLPSIYW